MTKLVEVDGKYYEVCNVEEDIMNNKFEKIMNEKTERLRKVQEDGNKLHTETAGGLHICECNYKDFRLTMKTSSADLVQVFFTTADNMLDLLVPDTEDCEVHNE